MIKRWLRNQLNKPIRKDLEEQVFALNKALMRNDPKYPYGHPHTQGLRDGLHRALSALDTEYK